MQRRRSFYTLILLSLLLLTFIGDDAQHQERRENIMSHKQTTEWDRDRKEDHLVEWNRIKEEHTQSRLKRFSKDAKLTLGEESENPAYRMSLEDYPTT